ncbi:MAG: LysM peptidoglycan-binding domain-containing protein, partial [Chloroflexi bacterium]|nr:LysM peptidoglycan-binding domain-containing protein [Chloroflexota bacterium]
MLSKLSSRLILAGCILTLCLASCAPLPVVMDDGESFQPTEAVQEPTPTALATRPVYAPGELVDYTVQTGDTLPALAAHFNTTEKEIRQANPIIPKNVTTLPPGMPMSIPIYYHPLWGSSFQILPDGRFVNGPADEGFDTLKFVDSQPGWLKNYTDEGSGAVLNGGQIV